jgi:hypothetical protein
MTAFHTSPITIKDVLSLLPRNVCEGSRAASYQCFHALPLSDGLEFALRLQICIRSRMPSQLNLRRDYETIGKSDIFASQLDHWRICQARSALEEGVMVLRGSARESQR